MENFSMMDFNYFDVTIAAIVIILGIKGFIQGFIKELFGLAGLIGGVYFASRFSDKVGGIINETFLKIDNPALLKLIGFLSILLVIWIVATILGAIFSKLTDKTGLGFINRVFGFIAGGGKYFLIFALIVTALSNVTLVKDNLEKHVEHSILYPYLKQVGSYLINIDPKLLDLTIKPAILAPTDTNSSSTIETNSTNEENSSVETK